MAIPYPALSDGAATQALSESGCGKQVHWQAVDWIDSPEKISERVIEAAAQGAKVLVIRNTVPAALATFSAIEKLASDRGLQGSLFHVGGLHTVHHSRYSREDRPLLDQAVEQQIGKTRSKPLQACIVVGTQTLDHRLPIERKAEA